VNHALATRDVGTLETTVAEIDDPVSAKRLLDRIAAAAEKGEVPDQEDIAALSALSSTQVRGSAFDARLAENGIRMPAAAWNVVSRRCRCYGHLLNPTTRSTIA
jgi:hypothetical protein